MDLIEDWSYSPSYWVCFFVFLFFLSRFVKVRFLDPYFQILIYLSFTFAATLKIISYFPELFFLNLGIVLCWLVGWLYASSIFREKKHYIIESSIICSRLFFYIVISLIAFYVLLFVFERNLYEDPFGLISASLLDSGAARKENKFLTALGFAVSPLFAIVLVSPRKNTAFLWVTGIILVATMTLAGSKIGGGSILLIFLASYYYKGGSLNFARMFAIVFVFFSIPFLIFLIEPSRFGGEGDGVAILFNRLIYRLVASNDLLALSIENGINLNKYPFSGPLQLVDPFIKLLGLREYGFKYSVGEWMYGSVFGVWSGVGPNPTYLVEFWLGLGYVAPLFFLFVGFFMNYIKNNKSPLFFGLYTLTPVLFIDFSLYQLIVISYGLCLIACWLLSYILIIIYRTFAVHKFQVKRS